METEEVNWIDEVDHSTLDLVRGNGLFVGKGIESANAYAEE
jgi:hypothetical protein